MPFNPFPAVIPPITIESLTEKLVPIGADEIQISDSEDSNASKKISLANLPSSGGGGAPTSIIQVYYNYLSGTYWPNDASQGAPIVIGLRDGAAILHTFAADCSYSFSGAVWEGEFSGTFPYADGSIPTGPAYAAPIRANKTELNLQYSGTALAGDKLLCRIVTAINWASVSVRGSLLIWA